MFILFHPLPEDKFSAHVSGIEGVEIVEVSIHVEKGDNDGANKTDSKEDDDNCYLFPTDKPLVIFRPKYCEVSSDGFVWFSLFFFCFFISFTNTKTISDCQKQQYRVFIWNLEL